MLTRHITVILTLVGLTLTLGSCAIDYPEWEDGIYTSPDGKAELEIRDGVKILKLRGNAYENGYNHGYLLAEEIVIVVDEFSCWGASKVENYETFENMQPRFAWDEATLDELEGMLAGIQDKLTSKERMIKPKGQDKREINLTDLKVYNTLADWAMCSSFAIWNEGRADSSVLMVRNLDFVTDLRKAFKRSHLIVSYDDGINARWINVAMVGLVGCISGMNEYGLSAAIHNTDFLETTDDDGYVPRIVALRRLLEQTNASSTPKDLKELCEAIPNYQGNNFIVCFPRDGRTNDEIAAVIEYDGDATHPDGRATLRLPSDNPSLPTGKCPGDKTSYDQTLDYTYCIINTNHYMKRRTSMPENENSADRVVRIKYYLDEFKTDGNVDLDESLEIMADVGSDGLISLTLHTVAFEPDAMKIHAWFSDLRDASYLNERHDYTFDDLF
ncbi:hypothetical protein JXM67_14870 [candidate division WOR-3 bacterium]|nr:hypothetical protein [candidate division WOR-3 bacterium]